MRWTALAAITLAAATLACETVLGSGETIGPPQGATTTAAPEPMATATSAAAATEVPTATSGSAAAADLDPCQLLNAEDVEAVYGQDPGQPEAVQHDYVALGPSPACLWRGVGARITVLLPPPGQDPAAYYAETVRRMHPSEPVPDLGDEAWTDPGDGDLLFRSGQEYILVEHVPNSRSAEAPELTRGLAELILANLP